MFDTISPKSPSNSNDPEIWLKFINKVISISLKQFLRIMSYFVIIFYKYWPSKQSHFPVVQSHWKDLEPSGLQLHGLQSPIFGFPQWFSLHWSQALPPNSSLHSHCPVYSLQVKFLEPTGSQLHGSHPSPLAKCQWSAMHLVQTIGILSDLVQYFLYLEIFMINHISNSYSISLLVAFFSFYIW